MFFLKFNEEEILTDKGRVSAEIATSFAESQFQKYRIIQKRLYQSDFDKLVQEVEVHPSLTGNVEQQDRCVLKDIVANDK